MEHNNNNNNNIFSTVTSDEDSDGDQVTDYLNANNSNGPTAMPQHPVATVDNNSGIATSSVAAAAASLARQQQHLLQQQLSQDLSTGTSATTTSNTTTPRSSRGSIHLYNNNTSNSGTNCSGGGGKGAGVGFGGQNGGTNAYNMVPIISVTPHSPGTKFSGILDDSLNQLQSIRESLMQMKSPTNQNFSALNTMMSSSRLSSSCPSLPDLAISGSGGNNFWPNQMYGLNMDRRKSWTAIEDLTECTKNSNKSASLSSVDSEESLRAAERLHNRQSRNSAGGISTHSLNEAELVRDIERLVKRSLAPTVCRIPLQKSISTPSIAPVRNQSAKEEKTARHLSDSEDENRSLLCVRDKNEIDLPEKRRKRGSLFFRKKKDKNKAKGQSTNCDVCGAVINLASYKEHAIECKAKLAKSHSGKSGSGKSKSGSHSHNDDGGRDYYDGHNQNEQHINYADDVPLIKGEFLYEPQIGPHDLGAEPILGIAAEEHDSWSPSVPKEVVKSLKDKQVKRQEHIYEFIMTEKHHCQTLLVMQRVFVDSIQKYFNDRALERMFPRMVELTELHTNFLKKLRQKQHQYYIVDSIADILLEFFSALSAQRLKSAYGEFCSNHRSALDTFKRYMTENAEFAEWYKHCQANPLLKKKGIPECILFVTQRLTKYPLLIDPLLKSSRDDKVEQEKLQKAMLLVKEILVDVDAKVAEKEKEERRLSIYKKIDVKSFAMYKKTKFRKSDMIDTNRQLKFEGVATLMQGRSKMQTVTVVVMSDCLFFLQENSQKYTFFTPENKAGVVSLQKLLIREKAGTESRGIYIISSNPAYPEMYELKVQNPKDKNVWIQAIRKAVREAPTDETESEDYMTVEQKQKLIDARQANMREIIYKLRQKDLEQAILLEEKIRLMFDMSQNPSGTTSPESNVESFIANFGFYKDLVTDECDTVEIWKRVVFTIQEIIQLASNLYSAATGLPLSRSFSSVGEKQSDLYISPTLPKRAETFGGFDERRSKQLQQQLHHHNPSNNLPWRDAVLSTLPVAVLPNREGKRDSMTSDFESTTSSSTLSPHNSHRSPTNHLNNDNVSIKDHNYAALQVSDHLHTLLCIISQQMTTIQSLQQQLGQFRDHSSKSTYRHNDQLEELRNLQDKLQEEKTNWMRERELQERDLEEKRQQLKKMQDQMKSEQDDIKQQREQLYRKMEILSSQGLLLSPSVALPIQPLPQSMDNDARDGHCEDSPEVQAANDRRKDKWRTSSISAKGTGTPLSSTAANKGHSSSQSAKQQLPLKLSSLSSSTREGKSNSMSSPVTSPSTGGMGTPTSSTAGSRSVDGPMQMFPLKLADKKGSASGQPAPLVPHHSRTGSSPAVVQQNAYQVGNTGRTNTYPKVPDRVRIRSTDGGGQPATTGSAQSQQGIHIANVGAVMGQKRPVQQHQHGASSQQQQPQHHYQHQPMHPHPHHPGRHGQTPPQPPPRHFEKEATNKDEEVIYF